VSTEYPAIPQPVKTLDSLYSTVLALKEAIEIAMDQRGDGQVRFIRKDELDEVIEQVISQFKYIAADPALTNTAVDIIKRLP
jgi:hypothetical protein